MTEPTTPTGAPSGVSSDAGSGGAPATGWTPLITPATTASAVPAEPMMVTEVEVISTAPVPQVTAADEIATLVLAVPGVVQLHPGRFGEVATYLPGRRVTGIKLGEQAVEVHVVLTYDTPLRAVAQQIHAVVAAVVNVPVQVFIEDLAAAHAA